MEETATKTCLECGGVMSPIVIMDKTYPMNSYRSAKMLEYRRPDDKLSFWTGKFPSGGAVQAFLCEDCGRISLYGVVPEV
jgi:hypothetical protein